MFRIGEANTPGPCGLARSSLALDQVEWNFESDGGNNTLIGVCNPSGIANKHELFRSFPTGWWGCAETQASASQLASFRSSIKAQSDPSKKFRVVSGAAAPCRAGSSSCGSWTGVLQCSSFPLRQVAFPVDEDILKSGRLVTTMGFVQKERIVMSTVYLPPKGPTYPEAKELSERLLEPLTREVVLGRRGCRLIGGDFNCLPGALTAMGLWHDQGWREVQQLLFERHGVVPRATCKDASQPDQLWLSPEIQPYLTDVGLLDIFPDHRLLIGKFALPGTEEPQRHWSLPARIPWEHVQQESFAQKCEAIDGLDTEDSTSSLAHWSREVEHAAAGAYDSDIHFPGAAFGRCQTVEPKARPTQAIVPKHSRSGEGFILSSFLGRSVQLWFQQWRRCQHLVHFDKKRSAHSHSCSLERQQMWSALLRARGFSGNFIRWWPTRKKQLQGCPSTLPQRAPDAEVVNLVAQDFYANYKAYEKWNHDRRAEALTNRWQAAHDKTFRVVRQETKEHIDTLVDTHKRSIEIVDGSENLVAVDSAFPEGAAVGWRLNGCLAQVSKRGDHYEVHSDLLLCDGQNLECDMLVHQTSTINERLVELWSQRWQRHADVPLTSWQRIFQFAGAQLPLGSFSFPDLTYEMWIIGLKHFRPCAARGPDGWSREDLMRLPRSLVDNILRLFAAVEAGAAWPTQWNVALVHCIEKNAQATSVNMFRPITLFSLFYRWWAGVRTSQLLQHLSTFAHDEQYGFLPHCQASDVWWDIQSHIEFGGLANRPIHGIVADLVKAYNLLPRAPAWRVLLQLGAPLQFVDCWDRFLSSLGRYFVVRGSCSDKVPSSTGFPEGCPLSCCAMVAIDILWHTYQLKYSSRCRSISFVDNLELISDDPGQVVHGLQILHTFCSMLDIELDLAKLYAWSSTSTGRYFFRQQGLQVQHAARDLVAK